MNLQKVTIEEVLKKLPDEPGIYLYYNAERELVYVGKATSLRSRVKSYFRGKRTFRPIEEMIDEVKHIDWKQTDSVLEAVIWESIYIKKYQPRYNVMGKDNKSWNYIVITNDEFPRIETMRQHERVTFEKTNPEALERYEHIFGPYPGLNAKQTLKILRHIFRFSTCEPGGRVCFYYHLGQCRGVCTGEISAKDYRRLVIRPLVLFLEGKKQKVIASLETEMKRAAKREDFEEATKIREQLRALYRIQDMAMLNDSFFDELRKPSPVILSGAKNSLNSVQLTKLSVRDPSSASGRTQDDNATDIRVEGYDISNLGATEKVGSMVVFNEHGPVKSAYRKFVIKGVPGQSDVDSLAEMISRRLRHSEWQMPTLFLIDGGRPQINKVQKVFGAKGVNIPVVGIAKGPERKRNDFFIAENSGIGTFGTRKALVEWVVTHKRLLINVRDEAHRFAISFHRFRRGRNWLSGA